MTFNSDIRAAHAERLKVKSHGNPGSRGYIDYLTDRALARALYRATHKVRFHAGTRTGYVWANILADLRDEVQRRDKLNSSDNG